MAFKIEFTPITIDSTGAAITTATVKNVDTGEKYFEEVIRVESFEFSDEATLKEAIKSKTAGFAARVEAIEKAKELEGLTISL